MLTPPLNSYVQMGPLSALPTTPPSNTTPLRGRRRRRGQWVTVSDDARNITRQTAEPRQEGNTHVTHTHNTKARAHTRLFNEGLCSVQGHDRLDRHHDSG